MVALAKHYAHFAFYELAYGPIPEGMHVYTPVITRSAAILHL